jgi:hypothetical protein
MGWDIGLWDGEDWPAAETRFLLFSGFFFFW